jgi:hypothetical protein
MTKGMGIGIGCTGARRMLCSEAEVRTKTRYHGAHYCARQRAACHPSQTRTEPPCHRPCDNRQWVVFSSYAASRTCVRRDTRVASRGAPLESAAFVPRAADACHFSSKAQRAAPIAAPRRAGPRGSRASRLPSVPILSADSRPAPPIRATPVQRRSALRQYGCLGTRASTGLSRKSFCSLALRRRRHNHSSSARLPAPRVEPRVRSFAVPVTRDDPCTP